MNLSANSNEGFNSGSRTGGQKVSGERSNVPFEFVDMNRYRFNVIPSTRDLYNRSGLG